MYYLERKERYYMPNILGNTSQPVPTWRWKQVAVCKEKEPLEYLISTKNRNEYRIISNESEVTDND